MICEECRDSELLGHIEVPASIGPFRKAWVPCPSCGGSRVAHCCDGPVGLSCDVGNLGRGIPRGTADS